MSTSMSVHGVSPAPTNVLVIECPPWCDLDQQDHTVEDADHPDVYTVHKAHLDVPAGVTLQVLACQSLSGLEVPEVFVECAAELSGRDATRFAQQVARAVAWATADAA